MHVIASYMRRAVVDMYIDQDLSFWKGVSVVIINLQAR